MPNNLRHSIWILTTETELTDTVSLTDQDLIQLFNSGLKQIWIQISLTSFPAYRELTAKIRALNTLAHSHGLPEIEAQTFPLQQLNEVIKKANEGVNIGRRGLFARFRPALASSFLPHFPSIDRKTCSACDLCIKICPMKAIIIGANETGQLHYVLEPNQCDGCRLCQDSCPSSSIEVGYFNLQDVNLLPIKEIHCSHCGHAFHLNADSKEQRTLCSVCQQHRHHKGHLRIFDGSSHE